MTTDLTEKPARTAKPSEQLEDVVIRFAGDSGDGMQLTGNQFSRTSAIVGNDLATLPEFPAEIRAPAGTLAGVSAFQVRIADFDIHTPGDAPDVLVAMNAAALKKSLPDLKPNGILIVNTDEFNERNLKRAGYESNPLEDGSLDGYRVHQVQLTTQTRRTLEDSGLDVKTQDRCKNFFALGMIYWLFNRPLDTSIQWLEQKFKKRPEIAAANVKALRAGWNLADITEVFKIQYQIQPARLEPGVYRNIMGNSALGLGLVAASRRSGLPLFLGSYPITPASEILHQLSAYKHFGVTTFQAEDEIAAVCAAIGAAFGGALAVTTTSGPGLALKSEAINLALMVELPLVVCDIQRAGPSTGMPTSTEQSDLLQALFGRNGESPLPVLAARSPAECFEIALEAWRIATRFMVPVVLLLDGSIVNGAEPWRIPRVESLPEIPIEHPGPALPGQVFSPYQRDARLSRPWALPGTPGLMHRVGGLEKQDVTGNVSYDPDNHQHMTNTRAKKVENIALEIPPQTVVGPDRGDLLVLSWGGTYGACTTATAACRQEGLAVAHAHLRYLNPLPANLGDLLRRYRQVLIPELNMGQLRLLVRARYLVDAVGLNKVTGRPFAVKEVVDRVKALVGGDASRS